MNKASITLEYLQAKLDDYKASDIVILDLAGKTEFARAMIVVSATSKRHAVAMGKKLSQDLKDEGLGNFKPQGIELGEWVVLDLGDYIVHIFKPEIREHYNLEELWQSLPKARG